MSEEDQDFHIESADAGASDVIPCEAGAIKKGGYVNSCLNLSFDINKSIKCIRWILISVK